MYQHPTLRYFSTRSLDSRNLFNILKIFQTFSFNIFLLHAFNLMCYTGLPTKFLLMIGQKKETCLQLYVLINPRKQTFVSEVSSFLGYPVLHLYNKTRNSYVYMLPIAGQTAGPNGLKFFGDTHGWPREKNFQTFFPRATSDPSASQHIIYNFTQKVSLLLLSSELDFPDIQLVPKQCTLHVDALRSKGGLGVPWRVAQGGHIQSL